MSAPLTCVELHVVVFLVLIHYLFWLCSQLDYHYIGIDGSPMEAFAILFYITYLWVSIIRQLNKYPIFSFTFPVWAIKNCMATSVAKAAVYPPNWATLKSLAAGKKANLPRFGALKFWQHWWQLDCLFYLFKGLLLYICECGVLYSDRNIAVDMFQVNTRMASPTAHPHFSGRFPILVNFFVYFDTQVNLATLATFLYLTSFVP